MSSETIEFHQLAEAPNIGWEIYLADKVTPLALASGFTFEVSILIPGGAPIAGKTFTTGIVGADTIPNVLWTPPAGVFSGLLGLYALSLKYTTGGHPRYLYRGLRIYK